jgi:hypothetical protein
MITLRFINFAGRTVAPDVRRAMIRAVRRLRRGTLVRHPLTILVPSAPAIALDASLGKEAAPSDRRRRKNTKALSPVGTGFGVFMFERRLSKGSRIALAGCPAREVASGWRDREWFVIHTLAHELAHYEQVRDKKPACHNRAHHKRTMELAIQLRGY